MQVNGKGGAKLSCISLEASYNLYIYNNYIIIIIYVYYIYNKNYIYSYIIIIIYTVRISLNRSLGLYFLPEGFDSASI